MKTAQRKLLSQIMTAAWTLARQGAKDFGGAAKLYFAVALQLVWQETKAAKNVRRQSVWRAGIGVQMWIPGVPLPEQINHGQHMLPGIMR